MDKIGGNAGDPQSWNRYAYAGNNPVAYKDSNGLIRFKTDADRAAFDVAEAEFAGVPEAKEAFAAARALTGDDEPTLDTNNSLDVNKTDDYDPRHNSLLWNPNAWLDVSDAEGSRGTNGSYLQDPALILYHEISHLMRYRLSPGPFMHDWTAKSLRYDNPEDARVITGSEDRAAKAANRRRHKGKLVSPLPSSSKHVAEEPNASGGDCGTSSGGPTPCGTFGQEGVIF